MSDNTNDLIRRGDAIDAISMAAWRHEGADAYSAGMDAGARHQSNADYAAIAALPAADLSALRAEAREQGARMALEMAANKAEDVLFFHARRKRDATKAEVDAAKFYGRKAKESIRALAADPDFIAKVRAG